MSPVVCGFLFLCELDLWLWRYGGLYFQLCLVEKSKFSFVLQSSVGGGRGRGW